MATQRKQKPKPRPKSKPGSRPKAAKKASRRAASSRATPSADFQKILVLVRHAHRDKPHGSALDNGLSEQGRGQAIEIRERFLRQYGANGEAFLVSSPKLRCRETIEPLAAKLGVEVSINEMLDEDGPVLQKVRSFLDWWRIKAPALVVACSHGDWLPVAIAELSGYPHDLAKGGWAEFRVAAWDKP